MFPTQSQSMAHDWGECSIVDHTSYLDALIWLKTYVFEFGFWSGRRLKTTVGACFELKQNSCHTLIVWLTHKSLLLLFFIIYSVNAIWYHSRACGLVGEGVDPSMTRWLGVQPLACANSHYFLYLCYFIHFIFLFCFHFDLFFNPFVFIILKICWT